MRAKTLEPVSVKIESPGRDAGSQTHVALGKQPVRKTTRRNEKMSGNRGCIFNSLLFLIIVFVPLLGHIIATIMVFEDDHSFAGTILWLAMIWLVPFLGIFLYLVFGQRRRRIMFGQSSYAQHQSI